MVSSLYSICLEYLKNHTEAISSLENVPFEPIVSTLLEHLFTTPAFLNANILSLCSSTFSQEIRKLNKPWTSLILSRAATGLSALPSLMLISEKFPCFITSLQLGKSGLGDDDLYLLRTMTNLQVIDLSHNPNITDRGVSYLVNMATLALPYGMHYLEEVHLTDLPSVTDKCLKYLIKLNAPYLNLSRTGITEEVAIRFLIHRGGYRKLAPIPSLHTQAIFAPGINRKLHWLIRDSSHIYDKGSLPPRPPSFFEEEREGKKQLKPTLQFRKMMVQVKNQVREKTMVDEPNKRQRPTTTDYLAMFEKEIMNEY